MAIMADKSDKYKILFCLLILAIANIFIWKNIIFSETKSYLNFLDVGQGDASFINFKNSGNILIDSGIDTKILEAIGEFQGFFDKNIDILIISHQDLDHFGGFLEIIKKYNVQVLAYNGEKISNNNFIKLLDEAKKRGVKIVSISAGDRIISGENVLEVLSPIGEKNFSNLSDNNSSIVLLGKIENKKVLFTGDASSNILSGIDNLGKIDILKVSHHGANNGTSQNFLEKILPQMALIGVGENNYGHPAPQTINLLKYIGADILRTDLLGNIKIIF